MEYERNFMLQKIQEAESREWDKVANLVWRQIPRMTFLTKKESITNETKVHNDDYKR